MGLRLLLPVLLLWTQRTQGSELDPKGRHVCVAKSPSAELQCCPGWTQKDRECTIPICEGPDACREDEVCVKPGLCRCKPGFFGAQCNSRCPGQYWGPDCRESCACHPHGQCEPDTGVCHCQDDRWGSRCEFKCTCSPHGRCDPKTGKCHCEPGWWSTTCHHSCQCNPVAARCDQATGNCLCKAGWWGRRCSFSCNCHGSPCLQESGRCACQPGWWGTQCQQRCKCVRGHCSATSGQCACPPGFRGARCELPCPAGRYGAQCSHRCGHCKQNEPCSADTGSCESCEPGWNGTECQQPCPPGTYGESCGQQCPHCQRGEACQPDTGHCQSCDPGWLGPRCEDPCPSGTFGEGCGSTCPTCVQGTCDAVTGECVCNAGYWGPSCNTSCPSGFHGNNCSVPCECPEGPCHPVSGDCQLGSHSQDAALIAGILVPLLLLLLGIACCVCCCWASRLDPKDRPMRDGAAVSRMKLQVWEALTSLGSALPCSSLSSYKLPWVTVSHHDPEIPFNHSFIEPPSAGWASDDSFSSDSESGEEDEGSTYCVPSQEGRVPVAQVELPEASLVGGPFPSPEDASTPFAIPRTSSLARAKRPSVSFAEGTKFAPQSCQSSGELSSPPRKPKRLSRGAQPGPESQEAEESTGPEQEKDMAPPGAPSPRDSAIGHRQLPPGGQTVAERVEAIEASVQESSGSVITIYMLAGTPRKPEGSVQSVLRRFSKFQKGQAEHKVKSAIPKPPRQSLSRNKGNPQLASGSSRQSPGSAPSEELTGALQTAGTGPEEVARGMRDGTKSSGRVQELAPSGPPEQDPQKLADEEWLEEPQYENFTPISGPPQP
ncbi:scavenger receptor class F member 1 isoform X1 [Molossus molossus]|uniref:Scavenger receptor class F member 1 n=1 Tax=Molossus molossus TaxID=27622 RepID=A0A7J8D1L9_MOLMO|nr:scavenger receptor class F member 1 isoform X1 [Molossus molossus]KAF6417058.1 scavenger receptor class F member 1 [Molossus molossus]